MLSESLLLAAVGGAVGVVLAVGARRILGSGEFQGPVWLYAVAISSVVGVLFGLPACWHVLRERRGLTVSTRSVVRGRSRLGFLLLAGQVAMAFLVLAGAALLARNFAALLRKSPGFESARMLEIPNLPLRGNWDKRCFQHYGESRRPRCGRGKLRSHEPGTVRA